MGVTHSPWSNRPHGVALLPVPVDVRVTFGERVRQLRQDRGLSQEAFAHACRLDRTYISGIERGRRNPSLQSIARIARNLGVSLSKLFDNVQF